MKTNTNTLTITRLTSGVRQRASIYFAALFCFAGLSSFAVAQNVTVTGSTGADGSYPSLTQTGGAFAAINAAGSQTGNNIVVSVVGDVATEDGANGLNNGGWTALTVTPTGARSLSGSAAGPLINLNGASNVVVDGLNTGGNTLSIVNSSIAATASTIRFINDASNNTVRNCTIAGSGTAVTVGTILFSTGTTTGNQNNTIQGNTITQAGGSLPVNAILSIGTSAAVFNSGTITANNIQDYFSATLVSVGINIGTPGNSAWTITNNKLFQTATRIFTTANTHNGINVAVGSGYTITGNTIGFADSAGNGTTNLVGNSVALTGTFPTSYTTTGTANATRYIAINCAFTAGGAASSIQNNTVGGIALYTSSGATTTNGVLCGINVTSGNANIGTATGNTIGATSGGGGASPAALYAAATTTGGTVVGIFATSTNTVTIQNNTVGSVDAVGTAATLTGAFTGIDTAGTGGVFNISNNFVGNTAVDNIRIGFTQTAGNLSNSGAFVSTSGTSGAMLGIRNTATGATLTINQNALRGWANGSTGSNVMTGITSTGANTTSVGVTNNLIGTPGLGWMRWAFATSSTVTGINATGLVAAAALSITGNDFRGLTYSVSGTGAHTYINWSHASSTTDNINTNTFTNLNVNTTGSITFMARAGNMTATGIENCNTNSIVTGFTKGGTPGTVTLFSANSSSVTGSAMNQSSNNFSNINVVGAAVIAGWSNTEGASSSSGPTKTISNNTFNSWTATSTPTGSITGMTVNFSGSGTTVNGNTFSNFTGGSTITGLSLGSSNSAAGTTTASGNTIDPITSSGASAVVAITSASTGTTTISKNKIYDIGGTNAGTTVNGIAITGGLTTNVFNNLIGNLTASAATVTSPASAIIGINLSSTTTVSTINVSFNTVYINASSTGANFATSGISHAASATSTTATLNLRDNVIVNTSTAAGTGLTVAYRRSSGTAGTLANYGSVSNNNDFYAGTPSATNLIYSDGTSTAQTMAQYKSGVFTAGTIAPRDSSSFSENPPFLSTTGSNANFLHINTTIATQLESGGIPVSGIADDFDGNARNGSTPDVGADEFAGTPLDLTAPAISYATLGNDIVAGTRSFNNVTVTDASGVNIAAGTRPRVYYKKSTDANDNTGWKFVEASGGGGSPFSFTIDYSLLNGGSVSVGDTIQYFVVAQDLASTPNVGINSGTFAAQPSSVALTAAAFPIGGSINSYNVVATISGTKTVGGGGTPDYATLTGAGGAFADINAKVVSGNITINVAGDLIEDGTNALNQLAETGVGNYTVTIQSDSATIRTISGAVANSMIRLNGADRVTFDGRIGGVGQFLRFRNTNTSNSTFAFLNDATNNTIESCIIEGANTSTSSGTILFSTSTGTLGNSSNTIHLCEIRDRSDAAGVPANAVFSSGSAGAPNGSNTVSGCNIHDWTNAGVLVSSTGAGNGWTVNPSSFYQTAARSAALTAISIQGGSGHSILNNSIGGTAPLAGGSFLSTSSTFIGISLTVGTASPTSVQGNTIKNIRSTVTGFTASNGIILLAGSANIGNVTGNTVGSANVAERFEVNGDSTAISVTSSVPVNISNNVINNFGTNATPSTGEFYFGMQVLGTGAHTVVNNTITNVTNASVPDSSFNTQMIGLNVSATGVETVRGNTISNIGSTSTTAPTTLNNRIWGLIVSGTAVGTVVDKNVISNIYGSSAGAGARVDVITGLQSQTVANGTYSNNMISLNGGSGSNDRAMFGILDLSASPAVSNYYFNSVNMYGTATAANSTYAFNRNSTATVTLRDNIFVDSRSGGTGFHVALANTNAAATGWSATASNYNILFNANSANLCQWLGALAANNQTLAQFQAAQPGGSGGEANSRNSNPQFVSDTDLHINPAVGTFVESGGIAVAGINDDIDGNIRQGSPGYTGTGTAPDVGADEGEFTTVVTNDMQATAFIDPTNGGTKVANASFSPQASFSNNGANPQTNVTVRYRICTDGTCTTELYNNTQVIASIASGATTPVTFASTMVGAGTFTIKARAELAGDQVPTNDEITGTFTAEAPLSGPYTIGAGGNYPTLTQAVAKLNSLGVTGPVVLNLIDATYNRPNSPDATESYPIILNAIPGASATNTVTIKPASGNVVTMTGSSASALIVLNGSDFVTIDGSNNGTSSRNLTMTNTNTGTSSAVVWLQTAGADGATSNTVKNVNLVGNSNTTTLFGVGAGSSTISSSSLGTGNNGNTIQNCNISKTQFGIYTQGASAANKNTGTVISGNLINTASPNNVAKGGIIVGFENNITISQNTIDGILQTSSPDVFGISLGIASISTSTFTGNEVTNATVTRNLLGSVKNTGTFSAIGIAVAPTTAGTNLIANNLISGVFADGTSGDFGCGLFVGGGAGGTTQIYFNSILMATPSGAPTDGSDKSYCVAIGGSNPIVDMRNNILVNTQSAGTGNNYDVAYGYSTFTNLTSDNNDFFNTVNATHFVGGTGSISSPTGQATFANLQTATGKDANSKNVDPAFVSTSNLHLQTSPISPMSRGGVTIAGVTTDIDGDNRQSPPDMGADEITTYILTYTAGANGSLTGTTPQEVLSGGSGTAVTAVPAACYHFVNWSDGSTANPRTDTNVLADNSVTANFAITTYTFTYTAGANGSVTGTSPQTVNCGSDGTAVTAVPAACYHFVNWSDGSTQNPRTDTNASADITVTANFAINTYTLTYTAGPNGSVTGTSPQTVNCGSDGAAVTAVPAACYHFVNWSDGSTANPRTDMNVMADVTVTANFAINTYTLTYTAGANGSVTGTSPQTVNCGSDGTAVTAVPAANYHFVNWSDASTQNPRTDMNVMSDITVTANFAIDTHTVTYNGNGNTGGTAPVDPNSPYNHGATVTVLGPGSLVKTGFSFSHWNTAANDSGTSYSPGATFSSTADITLFAQWASANADLSNLTLSDGTLNPAFSSATTSYTANVPNSTSSMTVTPTAADANATIQVRVNGGTYNTVASGSPSGSLALNVGVNTIDVKVAAQDEVGAGRVRTPATLKVYTVSVTRAGNSNADLSNLTASAGPLSPAFDANTLSYTVNAPFSTTSTTVTPTASDPGATITVNGNPVTSGNPSGSIPLNVGNNIITVVVTAADTTTMKTYTINVIRAGNVTVSGSTGANGTYGTLKEAFDAINANGTQAGNTIAVSIIGDTAETAAAVLNQPATSSWTSLTITPSGARTVTTNAAGGLATPLIDLAGADNVTIDGLNASGNSLTISNPNTSATAGTSTIRFINGATNDTVTRCSILGSTTGSATTATGNVLFSTSAVAGGNSNNTVSNNNIGPAGANLPTSGVKGVGGTNANNLNLIDNNNIFDFFNATVGPTGVSIQGTNTNWTVSNNRLYQTATRTFTGAAGIRYIGILVSSSGNTHTVSGNTIGFGAANGAGTTTITGTGTGLGNEFRGIAFTASSTTTFSSIQGNIISGINLTTNRTSTTTDLSAFIGIQTGTSSVDSPANIGNTTGNRIGSLDGSSTIVLNDAAIAATSPMIGILDFNFQTGLSVSNNQIGSVTINQSAGVGTTMGFRGILIAATTGVTRTMNNNTVGGTAAGSITDNLVGSYGAYGFQIASASVSATGNTVRNIVANSNGSGIITVGGILSSGSTLANTFSQNVIHSLSDNAGGISNAIRGMNCGVPAAANVIERNLVHSLVMTNPAAVNDVSGIIMSTAAGTGTYKNNMVRLGVDATGASITGAVTFNGFLEQGGTNNVYFNSVYIGGSGVTSGVNTFGFNSAVVTNVRNYRDNIFYNARSTTSGVGKNYAITVGGTAPNPAGLTSNNNDLYVSGTNGFVGLFNAADQLTLANWRTATGQDAASISADPQFVNPGGTAGALPGINVPEAVVDLHITCASPADGAGVPVGGIATDYDNDPRSGATPDIGADEINLTAPTPVSAVSRKVHGAAGPFTINLPFAGPAGVESRSGGAGGNYQVVFTFSTPVTVSGATVTSGTGVAGAPSGSGTNTITVNLTGVTNAQYLTVKLLCVDDTVNVGSVSATMGVLVADAVVTGQVDSTDLSQVKFDAGSPVDGTNFRSDVDANGNINSSDVSLTKLKSGTALPP
jgi:hypothetical protein